MDLIGLSEDDHYPLFRYPHVEDPQPIDQSLARSLRSREINHEDVESLGREENLLSSLILGLTATVPDIEDKTMVIISVISLTTRAEGAGSTVVEGEERDG